MRCENECKHTESSDAGVERVLMEGADMAVMGGGGVMKVSSGSYAVRSVPRAGLAVLWAVRVGGQAAAGVRVVGGHVRRAL